MFECFAQLSHPAWKFGTIEVVSGGVLAILILDRVQQLVKAAINKKNGDSPVTVAEFLSHRHAVEGMLKADPPRQHTELLRDLNRTMTAIGKDVSNVANNTAKSALALKDVCEKLKQS